VNTKIHKAIGRITGVYFALLALALPQEMHAQFTGNNQTNIITGVTSNWSGDYYVGSNYVFDALLILNSGVLSNGLGVIGGSSGANSNLALVSGSGSVWNNNGLAIGRSSAGTALVISNGGKVMVTGAVLKPTASSFVGWSTSGNASNNSVLVTGSGSVWSNRYDLWVGLGGFNSLNLSVGNRLAIHDGAAVINSNGYVGYRSDTSPGPGSVSNNSVLVTGSGSVWNNRSNVFVGNYGASGNSLVISNGGAVLDGNGYLGGASSGANNNNRALVTGSGSVWSNGFSLYVGSRGNGNNLVISNGGKVLVGTNYPSGSYLGFGNSNSVSVTGNDSLWSSYGGLTVSGSGNRLIISNGGKAINNQPSYVGGNSNSVLVTGSGSVWSNDAPRIGSSGAGNTLVISNGGAVFTASHSSGDNAAIGGGFFGSSGSNNAVVVTGSGSVWNNNGELFVGFSGSGNRLVIRDGGAVVSGAGWIGYCDTPGGCDNNGVLVTDPGSVWSNKCGFFGYCGLFVGGYGDRGSSLVISNGGRVDSTAKSEVSSKSSVLLTGNGSAWTTANTLYIAGAVTFNGGTISANTLVLHETLAKLTFNRGLLNSASTGVTNAQQFVVGDGTNSATFHLLGGVHFFTDGLRIRTNSFLTGCGTINGSVLVDAGGTLQADCGGTITFTGNVTNNGVMIADNGSVLESSGTLVNNGTILLLDSSTANFHGTFINHGVISKPDIHLTIERDGSGGLFIRFTGAPDVTYRLQRAVSVTGTWFDLATNTAPAPGLIEHHETSPPPGQAFYRTQQP